MLRPSCMYTSLALCPPTTHCIILCFFFFFFFFFSSWYLGRPRLLDIAYHDCILIPSWTFYLYLAYVSYITAVFCISRHPTLHVCPCSARFYDLRTWSLVRLVAKHATCSCITYLSIPTHVCINVKYLSLLMNPFGMYTVRVRHAHGEATARQMEKHNKNKNKNKKKGPTKENTKGVCSKVHRARVRGDFNSTTSRYSLPVASASASAGSRGHGLRGARVKERHAGAKPNLVDDHIFYPRFLAVLLYVEG